MPITFVVTCPQTKVTNDH